MLIGFLFYLLPLGGEVPLPATVTASSTRAGTDAGMLMDGRRDTAWLADAEGAFSLGQWVRLDFGRLVDITRIEIDNGVQRVDGGVDQFCAKGRAMGLSAYGDGGEVELVTSRVGDLRRLEAKVGEGLQRPIRTRTLTLVIGIVEEGFVERGAVGISEVRVWGQEARLLTPEPGAIECGSRRLGALRMALVEHCAEIYRSRRPRLECDGLLQRFDQCRHRRPGWLPIEAEAFERGRVELVDTLKSPVSATWSAAFTRTEAGHWRVEALSCLLNGQPCGTRYEVGWSSPSVDVQVTQRKVCKTESGELMFPR